jgi:imidazolonepropionase-like amidohydrolase
MVRAVNPEFRTSPTIRASNPKIRVACASGVTTLLGIPGSGTNIGGFGVLYKSKTKSGYEGIVLADVGGMKVAQDSNPSRRAGDFGLSRAAMGWILEDVMQRAIAANEQGRRDPALMNLQRVANKEVPVLIHTAGAEGVINTARMWRVTFDTRSVLSHGSFDGWKVAPALGEIGIPINHGPRTMDYRSSRNGKINGSAAIYSRTKSPNFSLNTDSGVIPQEEFFLQGSMAARYDGDPYTMVRALTANPAKAFGIEDRVGSLEVGKDADVVIRTGDPLDPRAAVELVLIDGEIQYERKRGSQWF